MISMFNKLSQNQISAFLRLSVGLFFCALIAKEFDHKFETPFFMSAMGGLLLFYPVRFFLKLQKKSIDYARLIFVLMYSLIGILVMESVLIGEDVHVVWGVTLMIWMILEGRERALNFDTWKFSHLNSANYTKVIWGIILLIILGEILTMSGVSWGIYILVPGYVLALFKVFKKIPFLINN